jgi:hypothetical protein
MLAEYDNSLTIKFRNKNDLLNNKNTEVKFYTKLDIS